MKKITTMIVVLLLMCILKYNYSFGEERTMLIEIAKHDVLFDSRYASKLNLILDEDNEQIAYFENSKNIESIFVYNYKKNTTEDISSFSQLKGRFIKKYVKTLDPKTHKKILWILPENEYESKNGKLLVGDNIMNVSTRITKYNIISIASSAKHAHLVYQLTKNDNQYDLYSCDYWGGCSLYKTFYFGGYEPTDISVSIEDGEEMLNILLNYNNPVYFKNYFIKSSLDGTGDKDQILDAYRYSNKVCGNLTVDVKYKILTAFKAQYFNALSKTYLYRLERAEKNLANFVFEKFINSTMFYISDMPYIESCNNKVNVFIASIKDNKEFSNYFSVWELNSVNDSFEMLYDGLMPDDYKIGLDSSDYIDLISGEKIFIALCRDRRSSMYRFAIYKKI